MNTTQKPTSPNEAIVRAMEQAGNSPDYILAHSSSHAVADKDHLREAPKVAPAILASCLEQGGYA